MARHKVGQTVIEYIILVGLVAVVFFAMGPALKRGVQSVVKVTADQVGIQSEADQDIARPMGDEPLNKVDDSSSFMVSSTVNGQSASNATTTDRVGVVGVTQEEQARSVTRTVTDMGFSKE